MIRCASNCSRPPPPMPSTTSSSTPKRVDQVTFPRPAGGVSATAYRTHRAGELSRAQVGQVVRLGGWVHRRRDLGGLVFIDLRDRAGIVQVSFDPDYASAQTLELARSLGTESVVLITGDVVARPAEMRNAE